MEYELLAYFLCLMFLVNFLYSNWQEVKNTLSSWNKKRLTSLYYLKRKISGVMGKHKLWVKIKKEMDDNFILIFWVKIILLFILAWCWVSKWSWQLFEYLFPEALILIREQANESLVYIWCVLLPIGMLWGFSPLILFTIFSEGLKKTVKNIFWIYGIFLFLTIGQLIVHTNLLYLYWFILALGYLGVYLYKQYKK